MFKQLNETSRMVVHFTAFPLKNLQNSANEEILLVCGINYGNYTNIRNKAGVMSFPILIKSFISMAK